MPLYFGRVAAFVIETRDMDAEDAEAVVERQAPAFERAKPAFAAAGWRGPGPVTPVAALSAGGRPSMSRHAAPTRILIPLANPRTAADLVRIGGGPAGPRRRPDRAVHRGGGGGPAAVRGGHARPPGAPPAPARARVRAAGVDLRTVVRIGRRASEGVIELAAEEEESDLIIFGWGGRGTGRPTTGAGSRAARRDAAEHVFSPTIDEVVRDAPCDIAVIKQRGIGEVRRILAPVRGGPHAELALGVADALGRAFQRGGGRAPRRGAGRRPRPCVPRPSAP